MKHFYLADLIVSILSVVLTIMCSIVAIVTDNYIPLMVALSLDIICGFTNAIIFINKYVNKKRKEKE